MEKELLCRKGKRKDNSEWVEGLVTIMWGQYHIIKPDDENTSYPIDPETICLYTGQLDMYKNKIHEHDICKIHSSSIDEQDGYFVVEWDNETARFVLSGSTITVDFDNYYGYECEVIGNVIDNKELLGTCLEQHRRMINNA